MHKLKQYQQKGQIQPRLERITELYSATLDLPMQMYKYTNTKP